MPQNLVPTYSFSSTIDGIHEPQLYVSSYLANSKQKYLIKVDNVVNITDIKACWTTRLSVASSASLNKNICAFLNHIYYDSCTLKENIFTGHIYPVFQSHMEA